MSDSPAHDALDRIRDIVQQYVDGLIADYEAVTEIAGVIHKDDLTEYVAEQLGDGPGEDA